MCPMSASFDSVRRSLPSPDWHMLHSELTYAIRTHVAPCHVHEQSSQSALVPSASSSRLYVIWRWAGTFRSSITEITAQVSVWNIPSKLQAFSPRFGY